MEAVTNDLEIYELLERELRRMIIKTLRELRTGHRVIISRTGGKITKEPDINTDDEEFNY